MYFRKLQNSQNSQGHATLKRKTNYSEHMSIGIIKGLTFPNSVMQSQLSYKKKIAEEFVEVNLLSKAKAYHINGKLEKWLVQFLIERSLNIIGLNAEENNEFVKSFESNSSEQYKKLNIWVDLVWNNCNTIYEFVLVMDSTLRSHRSVDYLKENVLNVIVELRILMSKI